jgi:ubiquinone/menaquinone biosynthesis C-methylase UbiE
MNAYDRWILPPLLDFAMRNSEVTRYRESVVPEARGEVLEIGIGSGLNFGFYSAAVDRVTGLDPSQELLRMARSRARDARFAVRFLAQPCEELPLEDRSVDTVVTTFTLCSVADAPRALREMRRVLRPSGQMLFAEHGLSPDAGVRRWQRRLNPVWRSVAGGCNLDRDMRALISAAGFGFASLDAGYARGPRPMAYVYSGRAVPE